jgi:hypothetical protein
MEVNRKLNAFGAIIGAVGVFGIIISLMILMNSIQYLRGVTDMGTVTLNATSAYQFGETYNVVYSSDDNNYMLDIPVSEDVFDDFSVEDTEPIERKVYEDIDGVYHYYEDLDSKPMTVLEEIGMPFKFPILILVVAVAMAVGGFLWCFHGTPTKGRDLGELIQEKRRNEEANEDVPEEAPAKEAAVEDGDSESDTP